MQSFDVFDLLINSTIFGVFIYQGKDGKIVFVNDYLADMLGYKKDEIIGQNLLKIYDDDKTVLQKLIEDRITGKIKSREKVNIRLIAKNGSVFPAEEFAYTVEHGGKSSGLVAIVDKTKEESFKKLFLALSLVNRLVARSNNEEELLSSICNLLVETVGYHDATIGYIDETTKLFNPKYIKSKSREFESAIRDTKIGVDPDTDYGTGTVSKAYRSGQITLIADMGNKEEMKYWKKESDRFGLYTSYSIPIFKNNKIKYILLMHDTIKNSFNVDQLKLLEEFQLNISSALSNIESRENSTVLSKARELSHEWVVITDDVGTIRYVNKAVLNISGYSKDELMGQNMRIFQSGYHTEEFYRTLWHNIYKARQYSCRFVDKAKDGRLFYLDTIIVPITTNGKVKRIVNLSRDVTDIVNQQKQTETYSRLYNTLYHISNLFMNSKNEEEFLHNLTDIFIKYFEVDIAFIAKQSKDNHFSIIYQSVKNKKYQDFMEKLKDTVSKSPKETYIKHIPFAKAFKNKKVYLINDIPARGFFALKALGREYGINSCCALPIIFKNKSIGSIALLSKQKDAFDTSTYKLLNIISSNIEFILSRFEQDKFTRMIMTAVNAGFGFVVIVDSNFKIVYANDVTFDTFGYTKEELIGKHHSILSSRNHTKEFVRDFYKKIESGDVFSGMMTYKDKQGRFIYSYSTIVPFKIDNKIEYYVAVGKDITREKNLQRRIQDFVYYDQLTKLGNLSSFKESIDRFIEIASYEKQKGAVIVINPVDFKSINQAFGFETGDMVLKQISERLRNFLRSYDVIARLESDRFGILLKDVKREEDTLVIVANLLDKLKYPYNVNNNEIPLSFNAGLSLYPKDAHNERELLDKARIALVDAKLRGNDSIGFFKSDLDKKVAKKLKLKSDLEVAFKKKEFLLYYQPYVDKDLNIVGAEALLRWKKGDKIIPPSEFIDFLEKMELIVDVENFVLESAIKEFKRIEEIKPIKISINFSYKSFKNPDIVKNIESKLSYCGLSKDFLNIEIIERSFMEDLENTQKLIREIQRHKVTFSIDDFGTGYSSLSYLAQLSADYLKIDISFVRKMMQDEHTKDVVESIIFLAKKLNMKVIAEGVETKEQFELLKNMNCDYFQGYLFYKPIPEDELSSVLRV